MHVIRASVSHIYDNMVPGELMLEADFAMDVNCTSLAACGDATLQADFFNPERVGLLGIIARFFVSGEKRCANKNRLLAAVFLSSCKAYFGYCRSRCA